MNAQAAPPSGDTPRLSAPREPETDRAFGPIAVSMGYLTRDQLDAGLAEQRRLREGGENLQIGQILLKSGALSVDQYVEVLASRHPDFSAAPPPRVGRYEVRRELGRGGMGVVYEAEDPESKRRVALKILREAEADPATVQRLHREAAILAQLKHPNIAGFHEVGMCRDAAGGAIHFIAMEYVGGRTFAHALSDDATPRAERLRILEEVARAVGYAHAQGVLHRDLKPTNVLVEEGGRVVLTDFGLARADGFSTRLTRSGELMGTPQYMSPEQVQGRTREIDARTDVYALGVMLYETLTGRTPFADPAPLALYDQILHADPAPPSRIRKSVERELEVICRRAMEKDRTRRYASALALADDLARFRRGEPIRAHAPSFWYRVRRSIERRPGGFVGLGAAVAAVALIVLFATQWRGRTFGQIRSEAERAYGAGEWARALAECESALRMISDPTLTAMAADCRRKLDAEREHVERQRAEAERAYGAGEWTRALAECESALRMKSDPTLTAMAADCRRKIDAEQERVERQRAEAERYRRLEEEKIKPLWRKIQETRPCFYIRAMNIRAKLEEVERALEELEALANDPAHAEHADVWTMLGMGWYFVGEPDRAEPALLKAEELDPGESEVGRYLAMIYLERSMAARVGYTLDPAEVRRETRRWTAKALPYLEREPQSGEEVRGVDRFRARAYRALAEDQHEEVRRLCEEGLRAFPGELGSEELWNLRIVFDENHEEAIRAYDRALEIRPHYAWGYWMRGIRYTYRNDLTSAIRDFSLALEIHPRFADALVARGGARQAQGDLDAALADFTAALRIRPLLPAFELRGHARLEKRDYEGAVADLSAAIRLRPDRAIPYANRGAAKLEQGDMDGAIADCSSAIRLDPEAPESYVNRAAAKRRKGDLTGAIADCDEAIRLRPTYAAAHLQRGFTNVARHDPGAAIADFTQAILYDPQSATGYFNRSIARHEKGDLEGTIADLVEALKIAPPGWPSRDLAEKNLRAARKELAERRKE